MTCPASGLGILMQSPVFLCHFGAFDFNHLQSSIAGSYCLKVVPLLFLEVGCLSDSESQESR